MQTANGDKLFLVREFLVGLRWGREMVCALHRLLGVSVEAGCGLVDLSRSSFYYLSHPPDEHQLAAALQAVAGQFPRYSSRRLMHQLRRLPQPYRVGRFHVRRLMRQLGLLRPVRPRRYRTTNSNHAYPSFPNRVEGLVITDPDQV